MARATRTANSLAAPALSAFDGTSVTMPLSLNLWRDRYTRLRIWIQFNQHHVIGRANGSTRLQGRRRDPARMGTWVLYEEWLASQPDGVAGIEHR
jgi:hypothetical protein